MKSFNLFFKRKFLLFLFLTFTFFVGQAQFIIKYPTAAQEITVCLNASLLTVRVDIGAMTTSNDTVTINLAPGLVYIPGTVTKIGGTDSLRILEAGGSPESPKFKITPDTLEAGQNIIFTLQRQATCFARTFAINGGVFKDTITVKGSAGTTRENDPNVNAYNVNYPSISITQPAPINNAVTGGIYTRNFTITNGADGCADKVNFYILYPNKGIDLQSLTLSGNPIVPTSIKGDTLFFSIRGALLTADALLCNGENLVFTETFKVNQCNTAATSYLAGWGCGDNPSEWCQTSGGQGTISSSNGVPAYTSIVRENIGFVDKCTPFDYTLTLTNGGAGEVNAATMYDISILQGQSGQGTILNPMDMSLFDLSNVRIGTSSVAFTIINGILTINLKDLFTSDPDGAGGLADIDGDGYFDDLPNGQSVQIKVNLKFNCSIECNKSKSLLGLAATLRYNTLCDNILITADKLNSEFPLLDSYEIFEDQFLGTAYIPANINSDVPFRISLNAGYLSNKSYYNGINTRYRWKLVVPEGVSVSGSGRPTYGATPVIYTQIGDTIMYTSDTNLFDTFSIDLVYNCSSGGNVKNFNYTLEKIQDITTNCKCQGDLVCATVSTIAFCPTVCGTGPTTYIPVVRRSDGSLGWTDETLATRQSAAAISAFDLSKALYLDTIQIAGSAKQNGTGSNLHLELGLDKTTIEPFGLNKLTPLSVFVSIYRGGILVGSGSLNTASQANSTATRQFIDWDITSLLPADGLKDNDSIYTLSKYQVSTNSGLPLNDIQSGSRWAFYNMQSSGARDECNSVIPEMYLVGTSISNRTNSFDATGCNSFTLGERTYHLARRFNASGVLFQNEYRPVIYIDSLVLEVPDGYEFISAAFSADQYPDSVEMVPTNINGHIFTFVNPGTWKNLPLTVENNYGGYVTVKVRPSCSTLPIENINVKTFIKDFYYAYAGGTTPPGMSVILEGPAGQTDPIIYTTISRPEIILSDQTGLIQAATPTESWNVRISSAGTSTAPYTWLGIPTNAGINVVQVTDLATNSILTPIPYSGGNWYQLSAIGIPSGTSSDYRISFNYTSSQKDSVKVLSGWNCGGFPADPISKACGADSLWLKFETVVSEVEIIPVSAPVGPIDLCGPASYMYSINCSQAGNTINNTFSLKFPAGLLLVTGSLEAEYPLGANNWTALSTTLSGNTYLCDLTTHPAYPTATGLPGTLNAANINDRQIGVRFQTTTNCDFVANSNFILNTKATQPSGVPAIGNSKSVQGPVIAITGVYQPYTTVNSLTAANLANCGNSSTVNVKSIIIAGQTGNNGTIKIELPIGIELVPASLNCTTSFCPIFVSSTLQPDNKTVLLYNIPSGIAAGNALEFSIDVRANSLVSLGLNTIELITEELVASEACPSAPGGVCSSLGVRTGSGNTTFTIENPKLSFTSLTGNITLQSGISELYNVDFKVSNTGTVSLTAFNPLIIDFYCADGSGNPTGNVLSTYSKAVEIPTGGTFSANYTFTANGCSPIGDIVAVISKESNCLVSQVLRAFHANVIPVANADNITTLEDTPVTFNIISNDTDIDGLIDPGTLDLDPLTPGQQTTFTVGGQGTFTVNLTSGDLTFVPVANFNGLVTPVNYQVCDNGVPAMCNQAIITVTVIAVNDPPVAVADNFGTKENQKLEGNILGNDYDVDGDIILVDIIPVQPPAHGTLVLLPNGDFTYQPVIDFMGSDSFTYRICDNGTPSLCSTATVTIVVSKDEGCAVFVPNSFSPNGDGIHDYFKVRCLYNYENPVIEIFNRWGNLVFKKDHYGDVDYWGSEADAWWTGKSDHKWTVGNELLPVGTYYYVIKLNNTKVLTGFLFLNK